MNNNAKTAIFVVIIMALSGILAFLMYDRIQQKKQFELKSLELAEQEKLSYQLNYQIDLIENDLSNAQGENEQLEELVANQKTEIEIMQRKISFLIKEKKDFKAAKQALEELKLLSNEYIAQINDLKTHVSSLEGQNYILLHSNDSLTQKVTDVEWQKMKLKEDNNELIENVNKLQKTKNQLSQKINRASSILVDLESIHGIRQRNSGKIAKTQKAKNMMGFEICVKMKSNALINSGTELFHVRVISPKGETITSNPNHQFENLDNGMPVLYSFEKELDYTPERSECIHWIPENGMVEGLHTIEVFNKGYLSGSSQYAVR